MFKIAKLKTNGDPNVGNKIIINYYLPKIFKILFKILLYHATLFFVILNNVFET